MCDYTHTGFYYKSLDMFIHMFGSAFAQMSYGFMKTQNQPQVMTGAFAESS